MYRLLRAIHLDREAFAFLEQSGAPYAPGRLPIQDGSLTQLDKLRAASWNFSGLRSADLGLSLARQISVPPYLAFRINNLSANCPWPWGLEEALTGLKTTLGAGAVVQPHPIWPDVITVATGAQTKTELEPKFPTVLATARAGEAILRGRHLEASDIFATLPDPARLRPGSAVSVFAAARDAPATSRKPYEFAHQSDSAVSDLVDRLIHTRYAHGAAGPATDAIFVGNGTWFPPWGVRMSAGYVQPMPLPQGKDSAPVRKVTRFRKGSGKASPGLAPLSSQVPEGLIPQSVASAAAVHVLSPQPGESILDLCAAPGGKAQHAAQLMRNRGFIVAVEADEARFNRMRAFLFDSGARIITCVHGNGLTWRSQDKRLFDRALVDAPCSASGLWPRLDWKRVTCEGVQRLAEQQFGLLATAARVVRPGGVVVYSVCSYLPQETEAVCARALEELPLDLDLDHDIPTSHPFQQDRCDVMGFFIARFRRRSGAVSSGARGARRRGHR